MEEQLLTLLKQENKAYSVSELEELLQLGSLDELKELMKMLNRLEDELKVYRTNKNKYMLFNNSNLKLGRMIGNKKGFGFVDIEGDIDVFVAPSNMNNAIHGDRVIVEIISKKGADLEGRIVRIVERKLKQMVGEYYEKNHKGYINLDEEKVKLTIEIDKKLSLGAMPGHKVLIKILGKKGNNTYHGQVLKILGHKNDPGVDILSIVNKYGIEDEFSEEVLAAVAKLPEEVREEDKFGRKDLRKLVTFTIDGADAKDLDDAISYERMDNGNHHLWVHIADVSYYVKAGSKLDEDAFLRGTSVYLADRVIPMLPHKLSNGICSLNGGVDRLAVTCEMEINPKGKVVSYDIYPSIIHSDLRMTYQAVNEILEQGTIPDGYEPFVNILKGASELAHDLRQEKMNRGYIDFGIDEAKIIVDESGEAIDIKKRERGTGEKLIEDFMIVANETVATHIYFLELPFVYRVHGQPNEEKITNFISFVKQLGYQVGVKVDDLHPKTMQKILVSLSDKKESHILSSLLLRSMQKAIYAKDNIGHYGLASKYYTHFTSPIRRYPDTTVHRLLRTYLFENHMDHGTTTYWENRLDALCEHVSQKERDAVACEREVDDMKKAEYMMKHIGETYEGIVSSVLSFGMFVELDNLVEGLVRITDMKDDQYTYDEATFSLKGAKNKRGYRLGDRIKVMVANANKEAKTIDFVLVPDEKKENNQPEKQ